ncbi:hypothetical protein TNCV_185211 [Trichonephila clavipes]|nr:hypothetical protein TNCV_185211 [Trichonephila clavipes]
MFTKHSRSSSTVVSDTDCCAVGSGFASRRRLGCTEYRKASTYAPLELRDFQILAIRLLFERKKIGEIDNVFEEVADIAGQINLEVDNDDVQ